MYILHISCENCVCVCVFVFGRYVLKVKISLFCLSIPLLPPLSQVNLTSERVLRSCERVARVGARHCLWNRGYSYQLHAWVLRLN